MTEPLLFAIEEVPRPKGKRTHGARMGTKVRGEDVWQCGNALCGVCAAAFHTEVGADLCDFRAPSGERCRYTANHGRPLNPPPEVPTHMCIPECGCCGPQGNLQATGPNGELECWRCCHLPRSIQEDLP